MLPPVAAMHHSLAGAYEIFQPIAHGGGRVVSASGSETSISSSTPASAIIYDAYTSIINKKKNIPTNLLWLIIDNEVWQVLAFWGCSERMTLTRAYL